MVIKLRYAVPAVIAVVALTLGAVAGCSKFSEPWNDADISSQNDDPAEVFSMPDGFSNFAAKCDGPNRVYVLYHGDNAYGSIAVVPDDPRCQ